MTDLAKASAEGQGRAGVMALRGIRAESSRTEPKTASAAGSTQSSVVTSRRGRGGDDADGDPDMVRGDSTVAGVACVRC